MFEQVCAASVRNQLCKHFCWLLLIDPDTPAAIIDRLRKLLTDICADIVPVTYPLDWIQVLGNFIPEDEKFILTTRMDNDDAIASDFTQSVFSLATALIEIPAGQLPIVIDFSSGYEFDGKSFFPMKREGTNFASLVSPISRGRKLSFSTVYDRQHRDLVKHYQTVMVWTSQPMWCQSIHERNARNVLAKEGEAVLDATIARARFGMLDSAAWSATVRQLSISPGDICIASWIQKNIAGISEVVVRNPARASFVEYELRLHPATSGPTSVTLQGLPIQKDAQFAAFIRNPHPLAGPVEFFLIYEIASNGKVLASNSVEIKGAENAIWRVKLPAEECPTRLTLGARLPAGSASADYIWSFYRDAHITYETLLEAGLSDLKQG